VQKYLENLQYQGRAYKNLKLQRQKNLVTAQLAEKLLKPKFILAVQEHFLLQSQGKQFRRKFLILDGPSCMRKTKTHWSQTCAHMTRRSTKQFFSMKGHRKWCYDTKNFQGPHCGVAMVRGGKLLVELIANGTWDSTIFCFECRATCTRAQCLIVYQHRPMSFVPKAFVLPYNDQVPCL